MEQHLMIIAFFLLIFGFGTLSFYTILELSKIKKKLNDLETDSIMDWYNMNLSVGECKNKIEYLEKYLKMKYPNMDNEIMEQYSNLSKNKY